MVTEPIDENVEHMVRARVATHLGAAAANVTISLRPPLTFQSNRLYDVVVAGRHFIAKEFLKEAEFAAAPRREYQALRRLAPLDVAPQPVCLEPQSPVTRPLVIYEYMAGAMWDRRRPSPEELAQLAALWLTVNEVRGDDLWPSNGSEQSPAAIAAMVRAALLRYLQWAAESNYSPGREAARRCLTLLAQRQPLVETLERMDASPCFCRSDARFANVIRRTDGRLGMVDWEDSGLRDPAREIADAVTHVNQEDLLSWSAWQDLLVPYTEARERIDPDLRQRAHLYLGLFPLFWLSILLKAGVEHASTGSLPAWSLNGMAPNTRLRRYLARALAWPEMGFERQLEGIAGLSFFPEARPPA